jgi:nicotinamide-nucleotide amidase
LLCGYFEAILMQNSLSNKEQTIAASRAEMAYFLIKNQLKLVTAESCTGGMISAACTDLAGSSGWFERGFVTYSNEAKTELLGVDAALISEHGAVSEAVARAMALGAIGRSAAQVSIAVTGAAGPAGGSAAKPVGTVWFGFSVGGQLHSEMLRFEGDRAAVRQQAVRHALQKAAQLVAAIST